MNREPWSRTYKKRTVPIVSDGSLKPELDRYLENFMCIMEAKVKDPRIGSMLAPRHGQTFHGLYRADISDIISGFLDIISTCFFYQLKGDIISLQYNEDLTVDMVKK